MKGWLTCLHRYEGDVTEWVTLDGKALKARSSIDTVLHFSEVPGEQGDGDIAGMIIQFPLTTPQLSFIPA